MLTREQVTLFCMKQFSSIIGMNRFQKPKSVLSDVDDNQELCVKHMAGSSKYVPKDDDSWKDFWERKSNSRFTFRREKCPCCGEMTDADDFVGAM